MPTPAATRHDQQHLRPPEAGHAHLVGIGGSGMRSLAQWLHARDWYVSGSDLDASVRNRFRHLRGTVHVGHDACNLSEEAELLIYSDAVAPSHPERMRAVEWSIPQYSYPQWLGELTRRQSGIAVAGTHGKSTTAAMVAAILVEAGWDPDALIGAVPHGWQSGARTGAGDWLVVEACEYHRNFLNLSPAAALLLGIEPDHFDSYDSLSEQIEAFGQFAARVPAEGLVVANADCGATVSAVQRACGARTATFGLTAPADWQALHLLHHDGRYRFQLSCRERRLAEIVLPVVGRHQVRNALAAAALAGELGVRLRAIVRGLQNFLGVERRLEVLGEFAGRVIVDDYAHHPTAVAAVLAAVRERFPRRRLLCAFQPHQELRTRRLLDEWAGSLQNADSIVLTDIVRAREGPWRPGQVTTDDLAVAVDRRRERVVSVPRRELVNQLQTQSRAGDVVVLLGAGDIGKAAHELAERL